MNDDFSKALAEVFLAAVAILVVVVVILTLLGVR